MYLKILETLFIVVASVLTILLIIREFGITKKLSPMRASDFVSSIAAFIMFYMAAAIAYAIFVPDIFSKILLFIFGISPLIIGKLVTYEKLKIYGIIQIAYIAVSVFYVILF